MDRYEKRLLVDAIRQAKGFDQEYDQKIFVIEEVKIGYPGLEATVASEEADYKFTPALTAVAAKVRERLLYVLLGETDSSKFEHLEKVYDSQQFPGWLNALAEFLPGEFATPLDLGINSLPPLPSYQTLADYLQGKSNSGSPGKEILLPGLVHSLYLTALSEVCGVKSQEPTEQPA